MTLSQETSTAIALDEHTVVVEPNAILHITFRGTITRQNARDIKAIMFDMADGFGTYDVITLVSEYRNMDLGSRHEFVHAEKPYRVRCFYVVGASFAVKTLVLGVFRAGRLLNPQVFSWEMAMVATEEEARKRIQEAR